MKQIDECLDRAFKGMPPLKSKKWKAFFEWDEREKRYYLFLFHYHHLILVYDLIDHEYLYEWSEKRADMRGLLAAKEYLEEKYNALQERI